MSKTHIQNTAALSEATVMTGGDAVVACLKRWDVEKLFGLPGVQLDQLFDALYRNGDEIDLVHTRHEQGAAYMAFGYAMSTGKPGICTVVPGPGILNAGAALATAYACNAPVLCLTSTISLTQMGKSNGALHEVSDQPGVLRGLTKWSACATSPAEIPELMDEAFRQLLTGRPRPVALEIPPDVLAMKVPVRMPTHKPNLLPPEVDKAQIDLAVDILSKAKRPLIVVGSGAMKAGKEVQALAERLQAPVISRQMGRGVISDRHPLAVQAPASYGLWEKADVVIGIGTRLQQLREWGQDRNLKVIRIDLDNTEVVRLSLPDSKLITDSAQGSTALLNALKDVTTPCTPMEDELATINADFRAELEDQVTFQLSYLDAIREELPEDGVFVDEMTQIGFVAKFGMKTYQPHSFICSSYQGTLGYGFATALGAQAADHNRRVISVNGDGGFMFTMPELASAVLHKIPLVAIVFADGNFGNVRAIQKRTYGGRFIASELHNPDFVQLAECFGAIGLTANSPEELRTAIHTAFEQNEKPTLIVVPMDIEKVGSPWKHIHPRKVR